MFYKIVFLIVVVFPFLGTLVAIWLLWQRAVHWSDLALFVGMYVIAGFGETVGFHRMLTHRSFQASPVVKFLLLVFGTMAIQGPPKLTSEQIRTDYSFKSPMMKQMILRLYRATDPKVFALWENALLKLTVSIPTLVLWGDHDPYIAKHFAERFGSKTVQHFPDYGHWLPNEAADEISKCLEEFFRE